MLHFADKYKGFKSKQEAYAFYNSRILDTCKVVTSSRTDSALAAVAGCNRAFISEMRSGIKLIPFSILSKWIQFIADECSLTFIEMAYQDCMMVSIYLKN